MKRIGLIVNFTKPNVHETLERLVSLARPLGITLMSTPDVCTLVPAIQPWDNPEAVISLGGDGSLLTAAHQLEKTTIPLIGFNIGTLGYLTSVNEEGFGKALRILATDQFHIEERTTLHAYITSTSSDKPQITLTDALNDVVVARSDTSHAVTLGLYLNGLHLTTYACDGFVVATPTGSTAYSLAIGGPILIHGTNATIIGIIAPHALTARPLVVPDSTEITIRLISKESICSVSSDGQQSFPLHPGDEVHIKRSPHTIPLIVPDGEDPFTLLSRKLGWGTNFTR